VKSAEKPAAEVQPVAVPRVQATARVLALLAVLVLLQVTFVSQLRLAGVAPDVLLLVSVAAGVAAGPDRGAIVGFVAGLGYDVFLQTPLGLSALVYCVVAYLVGLFQLPLAAHPRWWRAGSVMGASAVGVLLWMLTGIVLGQDQLLGVSPTRVVIVVALVNGLLALAAVRVMTWAFGPLARERAL
jgi:rod shape-determining protein MreD